jgi:hypothetical protein
MGKHQITYGLFIFASLVLLPLQGQIDNQPPYSYFGIGKWHEPSVQSGFGMGGVSAAILDSSMLNVLNPASYAALDITQFQVGGELNIGQRTLSNNSSVREWNLHLNQIQLGLPLMQRKKFGWGMSAGFRPLSFMGYDFRDTVLQTLGNDTLLQARRFNGEGGWNRVTAGTGFRLWKGIFIGINGHFNFGSVSRIRSLRFDDPDLLATRLKETVRTSSFSYDVGVQYRWRFKYHELLPRPDGKKDTLKRSMQVVAGLSYTPQLDYAVERNETGIQYFPGANGEFGYDTLTLSGTLGTVTMPSKWSAGVAIGNPDQFTIAMDVSHIAYQDFRYFGDAIPVYASHWVFALGGQFRPFNLRQKFANGLGFKQNLVVRAGFRYANRGIRPDQVPIDEFGMSFGLGIPVKHRYVYNINLTKARRTGSFINIGADFFTGQPRATNAGSDFFFRLNLGFTLREWWFDRPLYN